MVDDAATCLPREVCVPARAERCSCADGRRGSRACDALGVLGECVCTGAAPPESPFLIRPVRGENVAMITDGARREASPVELVFSSVDGAIAYEAQVDDSCSFTRFARCGFPSPENTTFESGQRVTLLIPDDVDGVRFFVRVRACGASGCSAWSDVSYFDVGHAPTDFSASGRSEVAVGAPANIPAVYSMRRRSASGPLAGSRVTEPVVSRFGQALAAGDLNGDGVGDLVVSDPARDDGFVYLYFGSESGLPSEAQVDVLSEVGVTEFGRAVMVADFDGDGFDELVVSSFDQVFVIAGRAEWPTLLAVTPSLTESFSDARALAVGDLNVDGYADLAVAWAETIAIYPGSQTGLSASSSQILATNALALLIGDLDADGRPEVVSGQPETEDLLIFWGASELLEDTRMSAGARSEFGASLALGSIGDDVPTLAVGAPGDGRGTVFLYRTHSSASTAELPLIDSTRGGALETRLGAALTIADLDGNGTSHLYIGSPDPTKGRVREAVVLGGAVHTLLDIDEAEVTDGEFGAALR